MRRTTLSRERSRFARRWTRVWAGSAPSSRSASASARAWVSVASARSDAATRSKSAIRLGGRARRRLELGDLVVPDRVGRRPHARRPLALERRAPAALRRAALDVVLLAVARPDRDQQVEQAAPDEDRSGRALAAEAEQERRGDQDRDQRVVEDDVGRQRD